LPRAFQLKSVKLFLVDQSTALKVFCARISCEFFSRIINFELLYFIREAEAFRDHLLGGPQMSVQADKGENRVSKGRHHVVFLLGARARVFENADLAVVCPREIL
jgi:hypothetical protein